MRCRLSYGRILVTRCPLSIWPDFGTVTLETDQFVEIIAWRQMVASLTGQRLYAEDIVQRVLMYTRVVLRNHDHPRILVRYRRLFGLLIVEDGDTW